MRKLLYVPIIHTQADLGSIGEDMAQRGLKEFGEVFWKRHQETVGGFWDAVARYFDSVEVSGFKVYQDGMVVDGELGAKIVEEVVKRGSKNYEIISRLLQKGAILAKTEDIELVREERNWLLRITQAKSKPEGLCAAGKYKLAKSGLLKKRDRFIAERIAGTLLEDETGILFIGAYHDVKAYLPHDIQIVEIKDVQKVREYQKLLPFHTKNRARFEELTGYFLKEVPCIEKASRETLQAR